MPATTDDPLRHLLTGSDLDQLEVPPERVQHWLAAGSLEQVGELGAGATADPVFAVHAVDLRAELQELLAAIGKTRVALAPTHARSQFLRVLLAERGVEDAGDLLTEDLAALSPPSHYGEQVPFNDPVAKTMENLSLAMAELLATAEEAKGGTDDAPPLSDGTAADDPDAGSVARSVASGDAVVVVAETTADDDGVPLASAANPDVVESAGEVGDSPEPSPRDADPATEPENRDDDELIDVPALATTDDDFGGDDFGAAPEAATHATDSGDDGHAQQLRSRDDDSGTESENREAGEPFDDPAFATSDDDLGDDGGNDGHAQQLRSRDDDSGTESENREAGELLDDPALATSDDEFGGDSFEAAPETATSATDGGDNDGDDGHAQQLRLRDDDSVTESENREAGELLDDLALATSDDDLGGDEFEAAAEHATRANDGGDDDDNDGDDGHAQQLRLRDDDSVTKSENREAGELLDDPALATSDDELGGFDFEAAPETPTHATDSDGSDDDEAATAETSESAAEHALPRAERLAHYDLTGLVDLPEDPLDARVEPGPAEDVLGILYADAPTLDHVASPQSPDDEEPRAEQAVQTTPAQMQETSMGDGDPADVLFGEEPADAPSDTSATQAAAFAESPPNELPAAAMAPAIEDALFESSAPPTMATTMEAAGTDSIDVATHSADPAAEGEQHAEGSAPGEAIDSAPSPDETLAAAADLAKTAAHTEPVVAVSTTAATAAGPDVGIATLREPLEHIQLALLTLAERPQPVADATPIVDALQAGCQSIHAAVAANAPAALGERLEKLTAALIAGQAAVAEALAAQTRVLQSTAASGSSAPLPTTRGVGSVMLPVCLIAIGWIGALWMHTGDSRTAMLALIAANLIGCAALILRRR